MDDVAKVFTYLENPSIKDKSFYLRKLVGDKVPLMDLVLFYG